MQFAGPLSAGGVVKGLHHLLHEAIRNAIGGRPSEPEGDGMQIIGLLFSLEYNL